MLSQEPVQHPMIPGKKFILRLTRANYQRFKLELYFSGIATIIKLVHKICLTNVLESGIYLEEKVKMFTFVRRAL